MRRTTAVSILFAGAVICPAVGPATAATAPGGDLWNQASGSETHVGTGPATFPISTINAAALTQKWSVPTGGYVWGSPVVAAGRVYEGSYDKKLYAIDENSGAVIWTYLTNERIRNAPAVDSSHVYAVTRSCTVYAVDVTRGTLAWSFQPTGACSEFEGGVTLSAGVLYVGSKAGALYALDAGTGAVTWSSRQAWCNTWGSPAVAGSIVYSSWDSKSVIAYSAATGAKLWSAPTASYTRSSPTVAGGVLYVGDDSGKVYAWNALTGVPLWSRQVVDPSANAVIRSAPAVDGGLVFVTTGETTPMNGHVVALNATTGAQVWSYLMADYSSSPVAIANGVVYATSFDFQVYALNESDGSRLWSSGYTTMQSVADGVALADGMLFVGSLQDQRIHAFGLSSGSPIKGYVTVTNTGFTPATVILDQGFAVQWSFQNTIPVDVTQTDAFSEFASGPRISGTFVFTPPGAGNYDYANILLTRTTQAVIKVPLLASVKTGTVTTPIALRFAPSPPPTGIGFDIQVIRPGGVASTWKTGISGTTVTFVPDGGPGTYSFRAKPRNLITGQVGNWSTAVPVSVS